MSDLTNRYFVIRTFGEERIIDRKMNALNKLAKHESAHKLDMPNVHHESMMTWLGIFRNI